MKRFFIETKSIKGNKIIIHGNEAHHIKDVIRLKVGDRFQGFDGSNKAYTLCVTKVADAIEAEIEKVSETKIGIPKILLACALPKKSKIDYIVEKVTELGVSEIVPMITERTLIKIDEDRKGAKQERWNKIAIEASKQCGRDVLPKIHNLMRFKDAVKLAKASKYQKMILPCLCEGNRLLSDLFSTKVKDIAIFIGPEGDFTNREIDYARENNFELVSLGPLILKVETACIFTVSVAQSRLLSKG